VRTATIIEPRRNGPEHLDASINPRAMRFVALRTFVRLSIWTIEGIAADF